MRYGIFDDNGNYCGYDTDSYEFAQERAAALNERYQQGLEEGFYHVEEIDDDDCEDSIDSIALLDIDDNAELLF